MKGLNKKYLGISVGIASLAVVIGAVSGCSNSRNFSSEVDKKEEVVTENSEVNNVDTSLIAEIDSAVKSLKNLQSSYIVETAIEDNTGIFTYIEVNAGDNNYTEYPLDSEDNLGTLSYGSSDEMSYVLVDLLKSDGSYYSFDESDEGTLMHKYPASYSDIVDGRKTLYVEDMYDSLYDIKKLDDKMDVTLSGEQMGLTMYSGKLKSDKVSDILTVQNLGIYRSLIADEEEDSNVANLCRNYVDDYEFIMVFSDANVMIGVDDSGLLRYMGMEIGGLGQRMYYTKVLVVDNNQNIRELPDTSVAYDLRDDFVDTADYVAGFGSYEEAMKSLNSGSSAESGIDMEDVDELESESITENIDANEAESGIDMEDADEFESEIITENIDANETENEGISEVATQ